jgi:hypothetical protein
MASASWGLREKVKIPSVTFFAPRSSLARFSKCSPLELEQ